MSLTSSEMEKLRKKMDDHKIFLSNEVNKVHKIFISCQKNKALNLVKHINVYIT